MSGSTLVSTEALSGELGGWRIFDCRHDLANPALGEQQYREGHIPGALFAHLDRDLSGAKTGANGRHPLPERGAFIAWLGKQGLKPSDRVACYDAGSGAMAARLWWMLRWAGHESVAVLDGGYAKWVAEKYPVTSEIPRFATTTYPSRPAAAVEVNVKEVEKDRDRMLLLDARAPVRFRGEQEPIDPVAGHIPGAENRYNAENVTSQGTFKSAGELRTEFRVLLRGRAPSEVVHYCGSGVAACHNLLAMEIAGLPGGKLYAGSWSEWSADPKRGIAR
ncbi:MAG: sulfurtransferase [Betaproteobacteria bacterium]|nr:MAG: sulfurtransferase [Betaproteobacteria bacterium]